MCTNHWISHIKLEPWQTQDPANFICEMSMIPCGIPQTHTPLPGGLAGWESRILPMAPGRCQWSHMGFCRLTPSYQVGLLGGKAGSCQSHLGDVDDLTWDSVDSHPPTRWAYWVGEQDPVNPTWEMSIPYGIPQTHTKSYQVDLLGRWDVLHCHPVSVTIK